MINCPTIKILLFNPILDDLISSSQKTLALDEWYVYRGLHDARNTDEEYILLHITIWSTYMRGMKGGNGKCAI